MWVLQLVEALELWEGTQDPVGQKEKDVMPKCIHPTPVLEPCCMSCPIIQKYLCGSILGMDLQKSKSD